MPRSRDEVVIDGRFRLVERLDGDLCGEVWLVEDLDSKARRVLQFLDEYARWDEAALDRVRDSWTRCQELNHENIARVDGFMADSRDAAVLTEYVSGWTLREVMEAESRPVFDVEDIRFWIEQCCRGLHDAHSYAQVVHGDLRPTNLWITSEGMLKITGFGKSWCPLPAERGAHGGGERGLNENRDSYRSPQLREGRFPRVEDDIYSLGAVLFELLAGRPPFGNERPSDRVAPSLNDVRRLVAPEAATVPDRWDDVIRACLAKEDGQRPLGVRSVAVRLGFELSQGVGREPEVPASFQRLVRGSRDRRPPAEQTVVPVISQDKPKRRLARQLGEGRRVRISRDYGEWRRRAVGTGILLWSVVLLASVLAFLMRCGPDAEGPIAAAPPAKMTVGATSPERATTDSPAPLAVPEPSMASRPWFETAERLAAAQRWQEADEVLEGQEAASPEDTAFFHLRALVDFHLSRFDTALAALRSVLRSEPRHAAAAKLKARAHLEFGEFAQAVRAADWALQLQGNANDPDLLRWRGEAYRHLGELDDAERDFTTSLRWRVDPDVLYLRGLALRESGETELALRSFGEAIALDPEHGPAREARALSMLADQSVDGIAIEDFDFLIEREEDAARRDSHQLNRLLAWLAMDDAEGVVADATSLLERRPEWVSLRLYRAEGLRKLGDFEGAAQDFEAFLAEGGEASVNVFADLAECRFKLGRFAEAAEAYTQLLSIDSEFGAAYNARAYAWYLLGEEVSSRSEKVQYRKQAMADCVRVMEDFPAAITENTFVVKGWLYFKMGAYDDAEKTGQLGLRYFPDSEGLFRELLKETKQARAAKAIRAAREAPKERPSFLDRLFGRSKRRSEGSGD